jgi:cytochrome P450
MYTPERWTPEFETTLLPEHYLPFGLGRRSCIGEGFAMMQLELILSQIINRFEITPLDGKHPELTGTLTLRPKNDILVRINEVAV